MREISKIIILFSLFLFLTFFGISVKAGSEHNTSGYAWSENTGWVSFNSLSDGSPINYGVNIDPVSGDLSGYAWTEHLGWMSFNRSDTGNPPSPPFNGGSGPIAQYDSATGQLTGWMKLLTDGGGWDGWLRFESASIDGSDDWHGWAWSDIVEGWLSFNSADPGAGGAPYKVTIGFSPPDVDIRADGSDGPITIGYNTSAQLTWTSAEAISCTGNWGANPKPLQMPAPGESTGNLTSSQTYTLTCDNLGGPRSDSVTVNVESPTLSVSLSANPASGLRPLDTTLRADVSGTAIGTINYSFWWDCDSPTTDVGVAVAACGNLPAPIWGSCVTNSNGAKCDAMAPIFQEVDHTYDTKGTYSAKVIIERDSLAAEDRETIDVLNNPPGAASLSTNAAVIDYCSQSPAFIILSWQFTDSDPTDTQSAYQVQVTRVSDGQTYDSGKKPGDASSITAFQINAEMGSNFIWYDSSQQGYTWRVKVWDSDDTESVWAVASRA